MELPGDILLRRRASDDEVGRSRRTARLDHDLPRKLIAPRNTTGACAVFPTTVAKGGHVDLNHQYSTVLPGCSAGDARNWTWLAGRREGGR